MNGEEILQALNGKLGTKINFLGIHTLHTLHEVVNEVYSSYTSGAFILNTLPIESKTNTMGHWVGVYLNGASLTTAFFDSYNLEPKIYSTLLHHALNPPSRRAYYRNSFRLQSLSSYVCGIYALHFIYHCSHYGVRSAFNYFHKYFNKRNPVLNDRMIVKIAYKLYRMPRCVKTFCLHKHDRYCVGNCPLLHRGGGTYMATHSYPTRSTNGGLYRPLLPCHITVQGTNTTLHASRGSRPSQTRHSLRATSSTHQSSHRDAIQVHTSG